MVYCELIRHANVLGVNLVCALDYRALLTCEGVPSQAYVLIEFSADDLWLWVFMDPLKNGAACKVFDVFGVNTEVLELVLSVSVAHD